MKATRPTIIAGGAAPFQISETPICIWPGCDADAFIDFPICASHVYAVHRRVIEAAAKPKRRAFNPPAKPKPKPKPKQGLVYFMRFDRQVKIGFTTNLAGRVRDLRPDEVLGVMDGTMAFERELHFKFGPHWITGERFEMADEIMRYIAENATRGSLTNPRRLD